MKSFFQEKKLIILLLLVIGFVGGYFILNTVNQTPTITLSPKQYSNEVRDLPPIKSKEDILANQDIYLKHFTEQIEMYGDWATRFLTDNTIESLEEFDVNGDGKNETIIGLCSLGGNHCPHEIIIVKNEKIVFSTEGSVSTKEILKADTSNGFFIKWANNEQENGGFAHPAGYMKTKFVYKDGKFVPIDEQTFRYEEGKGTE